MRVNFMIVGAQKCGTTTLCKILNQHPQLVGSSVKEPQFFSETENWLENIDTYHDLFEQKEGTLYFEGSTTYTFYPYRKMNIWDDIYEYNPQMKFMYVVRNPFDRIISGYMHAYEKGHTDLSLNECLTQELFHIDITRYATQIYPYIKRFGRDKVMIIDFEDFIKKQELVLERISEFLGIDGDGFKKMENIHSNRSLDGNKKHHKYSSPPLYLKVVRKFLPFLWERITDNSDRTFNRKPALSEEQKAFITNLLRLEIHELQKMMNKDLRHWINEIDPLIDVSQFQHN